MAEEYPGPRAKPEAMDAYIAAWAETAGLTVVTFDSGFRNYPRIELQLLTLNP